MCGIAGWVDHEMDLTEQQRVLIAMRNTLEQRGPDEEGIWISENATFVHRRLTVVDPSGGAQPMIRQFGDHTYVIVYNGELYNTEDIRKELLVRGYKFKGHSDTEVLLSAYVEWGSACVERFNGIFAFGVWDAFQQTLFLARDRIGVKPLFYTKRGSSFLFGSELKTLLANPLVQPEVDTEGLREIFTIGPARTPGIGIFRNVFELKPGYRMIIHPDGQRLERYWQLESKPHEDDLQTTIETIHDLLEDAITRQLVADVPVCTMLSGGLDSSAISAFASKAFSKQNLGKLHTFSVDYLDNDQHFKTNQFQPNSDAPFVKLMNEYLQSEHHTVTIDTPELMSSLQRAVLARDLPGMTDVDGSLLLFCEAIKRESTVALSGECADEVFGGYPWFHREDLLHAETFPWAKRTDIRTDWLSEDLEQQLKPIQYLQDRYQMALDEVPRLSGETTDETRMREMFYLNLTRWMPTLLDRKDRMSMAVGLEVRVPFCDHRLVEYMWNVPWHMKSLNGREKGILREALRHTLPSEIVDRKKSPYPKTHNPAYLAGCREWLTEILNDSNSPLLALINRQKIEALIENSNVTLDIPWFGQLMNVPQLFAYLAQVDYWLRTYKISLV